MKLWCQFIRELRTAILLILLGIVTNFSNEEPVPVRVASIPYIVSIQVNNLHRCGGIIYDESKVLTNIDCLQKIKNFKDVSVVAGRTIAEKKSFGDQALKVDQKVEIENAKIAILTLNGKFAWNSSANATLIRRQPVWKQDKYSTVGWTYNKSDQGLRLSLYQVCAKVNWYDRESPTFCVDTKPCGKKRIDDDAVLVDKDRRALGIFSVKCNSSSVNVTDKLESHMIKYECTECQAENETYINLVYYDNKIRKNDFLGSPQTKTTINQTEENKKEDNHTITVTIISFFLLLSLLFTCFLLLRKKLLWMKVNKIKRNQEFLNGVWEVRREDIIMIKLLGEGFFGQVWKCEISGIKGFEKPTVAAVKTIKENAWEKERDGLLAEIRVMKELKPHLNVISLLGCCTEKDPVFLIMEYVNGGTLLEYLRRWRFEQENPPQVSCSDAGLTPNDAMIFSQQIASGMEFLSSKLIVHRDLAARNILLDDERKICKITDFGFARDTKTDLVYEKKSGGLLPIRWLALESITEGIYTTQSDVWSFGILTWEIVTLGSTPYPGIATSDVVTRVRNGYRLEKPKHCKSELYNIMLSCWKTNPVARPTFAQLFKRFNELIYSGIEFVDFNSFLGHKAAETYYNILTDSVEEKI